MLNFIELAHNENKNGPYHLFDHQMIEFFLLSDCCVNTKCKINGLICI